MSDITGSINIDKKRFYLGSLCKRNHNYNKTGKTLRFKCGVCPICFHFENAKRFRKQLKLQKKVNKRFISFCSKLKYNKKNKNHYFKSLGYTLNDLKKHLEQQFTDGMNWNNYGEWHIDHIIPVSLWEYNNPKDDEFKQCWALANLQPLWAKDNFRKSNNIL